jgi:hypothetical protein
MLTCKEPDAPRQRPTLPRAADRWRGLHDESREPLGLRHRANYKPIVTGTPALGVPVEPVLKPFVYYLSGPERPDLTVRTCDEEASVTEIEIVNVIAAAIRLEIDAVGFEKRFPMEDLAVRRVGVSDKGLSYAVDFCVGEHDVKDRVWGA